MLTEIRENRVPLDILDLFAQMSADVIAGGQSPFRPGAWRRPSRCS